MEWITSQTGVVYTLVIIAFIASFALTIYGLVVVQSFEGAANLFLSITIIISALVLL